MTDKFAGLRERIRQVRILETSYPGTVARFDLSWMQVQSLLDEVDRLEAENAVLRKRCENVVKHLREAGNMYKNDDGEPGPLGFLWGWRTIADTLKDEADRLERLAEGRLT